MSNTEKFQKLPPLKQRAYETIKELILSGQSQGGEALSVGELAERFGVSRTPVREALLRLEQEGLVETVPYRGTYVKVISEEEIAEVYEVRGVLEGLAARLATARIPQEELEAFESALQSLDKEMVLGEYERYVDNDTRFHEMIVENCGNKTLEDLVRQLSDRSYRIRVYAQQISGDHMTQSHEEHRWVLRALREGDAVAAERLMTEHLANAAVRIASLAVPQQRG